MKTWVFVLTGLSVVSCLLAVGGAPDDHEFKTAAARNAMRKYDAALAKAKTDYEKAVRPARDLAVKELGEAMKAATKAGDLKEANEINAAIEVLVATDPDGRDLIGTWDLLYSNGFRRSYKIAADGNVEWVGDKHKAKVYQKGSDVLLEIEPGRLERLSIWNGKLIVEHFVPSAHYPNDPPDQIGIGTAKKGK